MDTYLYYWLLSFTSTATTAPLHAATPAKIDTLAGGLVDHERQMRPGCRRADLIRQGRQVMKPAGFHGIFHRYRDGIPVFCWHRHPGKRPLASSFTLRPLPWLCRGHRSCLSFVRAGQMSLAAKGSRHSAVAIRGPRRLGSHRWAAGELALRWLWRRSTRAPGAMTSYYEAFEVRREMDEPSVNSEDGRAEGCRENMTSGSQPAGWWDQDSGWSWRSGRHGGQWENWSWRGADTSWRSQHRYEGENWTYDRFSDRDSERSWGGSGAQGQGDSRAHVPGDGGRGGSAQGRGDHSWASPISPRSPPAAGYDREGNPPSGEVSSVGERKEPRGPGEREDRQSSSKGKVSSSYPPIFRAKVGESYRDWRRALEFWLGGEGHQIPEEYIGPRIMVQLRDRAAQLVKHLNNDDVNRPGGMQRIFDVLEKSPLVKQLDKHRVDQHRKRLMSLSRMAGESLESYITRGNIYRTQLLGLDSTLEMGERFYVGHLLDHARLTRRDKVLVRTRAGEETEESITSALIDLASELEGESGFPIGASEPNTAGANGEEWLVQRQGGGAQLYGGRRGRAALGAEIAEDDTEEGDNDDESEEQGADSVDDDMPVELREAEKEAYAMHYKAKQRMAEVKKLRQFYKKGDQLDEKRRALAEKIKNTACHNCGEIGHWSRECPKPRQQQQQVLMATKSKKKGKAANSMAGTGMQSIAEEEPGDHEWDLLVSLCAGYQQPCTDDLRDRRAYMTLPCGVGHGDLVGNHDVLWCMQELANAVILDIGCLKSVAGTQWINQLLEKWTKAKRWYKVFPEDEVFRFGSGDTLKSKYMVQFQATFAGKPVILCFSVVKGECPPLLSRHACTQLGVNFDCEHHTLSSRKLGVKNYGLRQTTSGHYVMDVDEMTPEHDDLVPDDFKMEVGVEAVALPDDVAACVATPFTAEGTSGSRSISIRNRGSSHVGVGGKQQPAALQDMWRHVPSQPGLPSDRLGRGAGGPYSAGALHGCSKRSQRIPQGETRERCVDARTSSTSTDTQTSSSRQEEAGESERGMGDSVDPTTGGSSSPNRHSAGHRPHREGDPDDREGTRSPQPDQAEEGGGACAHRHEGRLPFPFSCLQPGGSLQRGGMSTIEDDDVHVEEDGVASASEGGGGELRAGCQMEEEQEVAGNAAGEGDRLPVWALRRYETEVDSSSGSGSHVKRRRREMAENDVMGEEDMQAKGMVLAERAAAITDERYDHAENAVIYEEDLEEFYNKRLAKREPQVTRPPRGLTQKFKKGIKDALAVLGRVQEAS
eukprot:s849_g5.t1